MSMNDPLSDLIARITRRGARAPQRADEGPDDVKVQVPVDQVRGLARNNAADKDLTTDLTAQQLAALESFCRA